MVMSGASVKAVKRFYRLLLLWQTMNKPGELYKLASRTSTVSLLTLFFTNTKKNFLGCVHSSTQTHRRERVYNVFVPSAQASGFSFIGEQRIYGKEFSE